MQASKVFSLVRDIAVLIVFYLVGEQVANLLPFNFPGSIVGMLLLFACLATGLIKLPWVEGGSGLLIRYMAVLFVPVGAGLVEHLDVLTDQFAAFSASVVVSTLATMAVVGVVYQRLGGRR